ncbi:MAG TPA: hypothetical protein GXZ47_07025 [Treponema sp.]|nr:hypothetical protein [Treponema sp.]
MRIYLITGIIFAITGLIMLFAPQGFIGAVVISLGVASFANGLYTFIRFRKEVDDPVFRRTLTIRAILSIVIGLTAIILPIIFAGTVWIITAYILAAHLIISAILELIAITRMKNSGIETTGYLYEAIASIAIALILLIFPGKTGIFLVRIAGALVVLGGIAAILHDQGKLPRFPRR